MCSIDVNKENEIPYRRLELIKGWQKIMRLKVVMSHNIQAGHVSLLYKREKFHEIIGISLMLRAYTCTIIEPDASNIDCTISMHHYNL